MYDFIQSLSGLTQRPDLYTPGTAVMWTDPHISKRLLDIHLSRETDLASRKPRAIEITIDWISDLLPQGRMDILDLGCGPGLYTERLATQGHRVKGIDFSRTAIGHARAVASKKGLDITYLHQDYLTLDDACRYDLIMMIFTDFGVLSPDQRASLLDRVWRALKPGGAFVFDVLNKGWRPDGTRAWEACEKGFWRPHPYLLLSETFSYEGDRVYLSQHLVADRNGTKIYRFYTHTFDSEEIQALLGRHGFSRISQRENLLPDSDLYRSKDLTFFSAVRPGPAAGPPDR